MKLTVNEVTIERGGRRLFAPCSFVTKGGTLVRITGANGAGKTTLLRALAGLTSVASGTLDWLSSLSPSDTRRLRVFIGHSNSMNDSLSAKENMAYAEGAGGCSVSRGDVQSALEKMGVAHLIDRRIGTLSQGQKKRVALSRLFSPANANAAWLLDEPFVALDAATQTLLAKHIAEALARGALVLLTSHQNVEIAAANVLDVNLDSPSRDDSRGKA